ncbi:MAG: preprotein translocase subunit SecE [Lachnospiraceae bacterium]|nr:preprotein translocase subunit SecE [Lachnospiraceae bacterium]
MAKNNETSSPSLKRSWFQELKAEFSKIIWPTKQSLGRQSVVVLVIGAILALIILGFDILIKTGLSYIIAG